jgi:hypothetical protein
LTRRRQNPYCPEISLPGDLGDVHGGRLDANILIGDVFGGEVAAKIHVGEKMGG